MNQSQPSGHTGTGTRRRRPTRAGAGGFGSGGARPNKLTAGPRAAASLVAKARRPGGSSSCGGAEPARRFACPHAFTVETRCVASRRVVVVRVLSCPPHGPTKQWCTRRQGSSARHADSYVLLRAFVCVFLLLEEYVCVVNRQVFLLPSGMNDTSMAYGRFHVRRYGNV
jgi:hypothetical protein